MHVSNYKSLLFSAIILSISTPDIAFAYIDPGAGSALIQIVFAGFFAALFTFKIWWGRLCKFFGRAFKGKGELEGDK